MEVEDKYSHVGEEDKKLPASPLTPPTSSSDVSRGQTWWMTDIHRDRESDQASTTGSFRWDFSAISFPDLGSSNTVSSCLDPPDPLLLPGGFTVGVCDIASWRQKINQREVKMSSKEQMREEEKRRQRINVNKDKEVGTL